MAQLLGDCMIQQNNFPILSAQDILLRAFSLMDAKEVQRQAGDPHVAGTTANIPHPYLDGLAEEWISQTNEWFKKGKAVDWAIELKADKKLIGCISLGISKTHQRAEPGYWI